MNYVKIDKDTIKVTNTIEHLVQISMLEDKLLTMIEQKKQFDAAVAYKANMPEDMQPYFAEPPSVTQEDIDAMEVKINEYKALK